jgi:arylsulfatase A
MNIRMKKRVIILVGLVLYGLALTAAERPNIIIILNDDQGYQDLGCFGSPDIKTPRIDQLAEEGMRFTDFYVASPVCSASRAALLTGCYPHRVGVPSVFFPNRGHQGLAPDHVTIPEILKTVGYATKAIGKWHLGDELEFLPTNQGFDSYYGIPYSNDMFPSESMKYADSCLYREGFTQKILAANFEKRKLAKDRWGKEQPVHLKSKVPLMRNEECIEFPVDQTTITNRFTTEGINFISESAKNDKPFFLYLANSMPHIPLYASPQFKGQSERGLYGDVIEEIDYNVGRILDHLKRLNIEDNTIVIFSSDNGPWLSVGDAGGSALPLFEGKFSNFEGGQRVPAIIRWPAKVPAQSVCSEMALSLDLLPTLAHITGAALPGNMSIDGKNIIHLITAEESAVTPHKYFFFGTSAVRSGGWKYHASERFPAITTKRDSKGPTLYNLTEDIGESNNIIRDHPEIADHLRKALDAHRSYLNGAG